VCEEFVDFRHRGEISEGDIDEHELRGFESCGRQRTEEIVEGKPRFLRRRAGHIDALAIERQLAAQVAHVIDHDGVTGWR
jgi:hypothetical protein